MAQIQSIRESGRSGGGGGDSGQQTQEGACRLILVCVETPFMGRTLRRAAEKVRSIWAPEADYASITIRVFDMSSKAIFDLPTATKCSGLFHVFKTGSAFQFPSPIAQGAQYELRLKQDLNMQSRRLFVVMGRVRKVDTEGLAGRYEVGYNGFGGAIYAMRTEEHPITLVQLKMNGDSIEHAIEEQAFLEFGVQPVLPQVRSALVAPF